MFLPAPTTPAVAQQRSSNITAAVSRNIASNMFDITVSVSCAFAYNTSNCATKKQQTGHNSCNDEHCAQVAHCSRRGYRLTGCMSITVLPDTTQTATQLRAKQSGRPSLLCSTSSLSLTGCMSTKNADPRAVSASLPDVLWESTSGERFSPLPFCSADSLT